MLEQACKCSHVVPEVLGQHAGRHPRAACAVHACCMSDSESRSLTVELAAPIAATIAQLSLLLNQAYLVHFELVASSVQQGFKVRAQLCEELLVLARGTPQLSESIDGHDTASVLHQLARAGR